MTLETNLAERPSEALDGRFPPSTQAGASAPALLGKRLVHRGGGQVLVLDAPAYREPAAQPKPKAYGGSRPAKAESLKLKFNVERVEGLAFPRRHTGYQPGPITDMGADQCRFIAGQDGMCCGAKVARKWACAEHAAIVFTRGN